MMTLALLVAAQAAVAVSPAQMPRRAWGDPLVKTAVDVATRSIYDAQGSWHFSLTKSNPLRRRGSLGTEISGKTVGSEIGRILAADFDSKGKYSVEYYLADGKLVFAYETYEWFKETRPKQATSNFKGVASWERRTYFRNGAVGYAEAVGYGAPLAGADGDRLTMRSRQLAQLLEAKRK